MAYSDLLLRSVICARGINLGFVSVFITEVMGIDDMFSGKNIENRMEGLGQNSEKRQHLIVRLRMRS